MPSTPRLLRTATVFVATIVSMAAGFGVGLMAQTAIPQPQEPFALYLTDAPANLTRLDVVLSQVTVGSGTILDLVNPQFDLAQLRGPDDALLVAQGNIPVGVGGPITVKFAAVRATVGGIEYDVPNPGSLVLASLGSGTLPGAALLDFDLQASLQETPEGLVFQPDLLAVYSAVRGAEGAPAWQEVAAGLDLAALTAGTVASTDPAANAAAGATDALVQGVDAEASPHDAGATVSMPAATVETRTGWLVHFHDSNVTDLRMQLTVESAGAVYIHGFKALPMAYVLANPLQVRELMEKQGVERVEREEQLTLFDAESRLAIRIPNLIDPLTGLKDAAGQPIDGRGIGVAVVDSGIYALHADLPYRPLVPGGVVGANYKFVSQQAVPTPDSDTTSGHGTHVAGILAGQSIIPERKGVAPGATIYGLGIGDASTTMWAAQAFDWILDNHDQVDPPIRIVTNSWGSGNSYDPDAAITRFVNRMVDDGLVVVFAAGNEGGTGSTAQTSSQCQIPKAGVICVAAYDDLDTGTRNGKIAPYSSRGATSTPSTWPDISAPGTSVLSTRPPLGSTSGSGLNTYVELSGTSMAAPHVAGVAALMLQMNPSLGPAAVELALKGTAYRFTDGGAYSLQGHFAKGYGLVDAYAAVDLVG